MMHAWENIECFALHPHYEFRLAPEHCPPREAGAAAGGAVDVAVEDVYRYLDTSRKKSRWVDACQ